MGVSQKRYYSHANDLYGLTLIEVLVALAIVGIAMTAIIKATSQNIRATTYLQDKTIATWVAQQVLNEVRVKVLPLPQGDQLKQTTIMLGKEWYWRAQEVDTPNKQIKKISVDVSTEEDVSPLVSLESYVYHQDS